jgi:hypothetical protein
VTAITDKGKFFALGFAFLRQIEQDQRLAAVAVVFDFVQPAVAVRRRVDQLRELRPNPLGSGSVRRRRTIDCGMNGV